MDKRKEKGVFIISSSHDDNQIDQLADRLNASCIYMDISEEECLKRIAHDPARPDKAKANQIAKEWFYKHEQRHLFQLGFGPERQQ